MKNALMLAVVGFGLAGLVSQTASAAGRFAKEHPRRAEVVGRANNEERKNDEAEGAGAITKKQEKKLDRQDQAIKRQEERQARRNGGHITKGEQARDNREENRVNRERNNMEKRDAAASVPATAPVAPPAPAAGGQ